MQDKYSNLPGILADFKDGGLRVKTDPNPPSTESVLLLGTAVDGPLHNPVAVDQGSLELVFGKATRANGLPNGSTLVKGFEQAYDFGCRDIRLVRVTGAYATGKINSAPITGTSETPEEIILGPAPGNDTVVFQLNHGNVVPASVVVNANGVNLASNAFSLVAASTPGGDDSVQLAADVTDSGAAVYVTYQYTNDAGDLLTAKQNGYTDGAGKLQRYIATASDKTLVMPSPVKPGSLKLYANGVAVESAGFSVGSDAKSVILKAGYVALNAVLDATYIYVETKTETPTLDFQSIYAGSLYNNVQVQVLDIQNQTGTVVGKVVQITKPDSKKAQIAEPALAYSSLDYPSLQLMVNAINADPRNNVVVASVKNHFSAMDPASLESGAPVYLDGGDDGLNPTAQDYYEALQGVYNLLENYSVDHVVVLGASADQKLAGKYDSFAYQLALACAVMTFRNHTTLGYIGISSPDAVSLQDVANQVVKIQNTNNLFPMRDTVGNILKDADGNNIDLGRFISVVAGPDFIFNSPRLGVYAEVSPAAYAGFVSNLSAQSAPTNKVVPAVGLRYEFSNSQLDTLTGLRFVTFRTKNNGANVAVTDGMTAAANGSDYVRLNTIRVVKECVDQIREAADPFIGEPNETSQQNALASAIGKRLDGLKALGVIQAYEFSLVSTPMDKLLGQAKIELTLVPPQELRKLTTVVSLKPSL